MWLYRLLKNQGEMLRVPAKKIKYCYGVWQKIFENMEKELGIEFLMGLPSVDELSNFIDEDHNIIIFDDLMDQVVQSSQIQTMFTQGSHHKNLTVIYINQNMYY